MVRVVSSEFENVRIEQYHCHALKSWRNRAKDETLLSG